MICLVLAALLPTLAGGEAPAGAIKLEEPKVEMRHVEATATMSPWIDANGWKILRSPGASYFYEVSARGAALAAAEAFDYGARASVKTDDRGAEAFNRMLEFLRGLPDASLSPVASVGVLDDGSEVTGELMNLLARRNLLYRIVTAPDPKLAVNVRIGSKEYPEDEAADSQALAQRIRAQIGESNRPLRLFGSQIVLARMDGDGAHLRVHLLNYGGHPVAGLRIRVLGEFPKQRAYLFGQPDATLTDVVTEDGATEFTVHDLTVYGVVDLARE